MIILALEIGANIYEAYPIVLGVLEVWAILGALHRQIVHLQIAIGIRIVNSALIIHKVVTVVILVAP